MVMEAQDVVASLGALAHEHRLAAFRILIQAGPSGLAAGLISDRLGIPPSSLTFHLQQLLHAGLISHRRSSRHLVYVANFARMDQLIRYLTENCCGTLDGICDPPRSGARLRAGARDHERKEALLF
jgi:DNA-binding transcriptional ArsR family regulator